MGSGKRARRFFSEAFSKEFHKIFHRIGAYSSKFLDAGLIGPETRVRPELELHFSFVDFERIERG
jgi:hypothetical protein